MESKRGGKRPGSGRPRNDKARPVLTVALNPETAAYLRAESERVGLSIGHVLDRDLKRHSRPYTAGYTGAAPIPAASCGTEDATESAPAADLPPSAESCG
ncbi:MAG TPA: hypothetical protein VEH27_02455 [Methylomirabilota bacterium]|nr:hypothetical protein [Methylomirabilota bacterium]